MGPEWIPRRLARPGNSVPAGTCCSRRLGHGRDQRPHRTGMAAEVHAQRYRDLPRIAV